jgi:hypothetical protein
MELVGDPLAGFDGAIGNRYDLAVRDLLKAGNVAMTHVAAGTDESDPNGFFRHDLPP